MSEEPQADGQVPAPRSCIECRRLKRKCDRLDPCNICQRHGKICKFPVRPQVESDALVDARLERMRQLLSKHAPDVDPDADDSDGEPPRQRPRTGLSLDELAGNAKASASAGQAAPPLPLDPVAGSSLADPNVHPTPPSYTPSTPTPTVEPHRVQHLLPSALDPPLPLPTPLPSHDVGVRQPSSTTTEALEKQPRDASGYEWDESQHTSAVGTDGTASLSMEPDGEGYLGFAAGATLLRMLQLFAGAISIGPAIVGPVQPNAIEAAWEPNYTELESYINSYFLYYHTQYPLVHEPTFRAQWSEVIPTPVKSQWEPLVNAVLGLGAFCSFRPMHIVDYFLNRATAGLGVEHLASGSLTLVQAFTLLSNLTQKRNNPNTGFVLLGIAVRMAIGLGLHRELPSWNITPFEREVRRRTWWVVYCFDSGASITFGRPILLPSGDADVRAAHNVADRAFTPSAAIVPAASSEPSMYTSLIYQSSFHAIGNDCYTRTISTPPPTSHDVLTLDTKLQLWYSALPEWIKPYSPTYTWLSFSAQKLFWRYSNLRIIIHRRAFLERAISGLPLCLSETEAGAESTSSDLCLRSARDSILAIAQFFKTRTPNRLEWWYGLHFLFHASFVPLIALHSDFSSPQRSAWQEDVEIARRTLSELREDPLADRCLAIIDRLAPSNTPPPATGNPAWFGVGSEAEQWLPFADLASLSSFWPNTGDWDGLGLQ